jgi:hypothetical protein
MRYENLEFLRYENLEFLRYENLEFLQRTPRRRTLTRKRTLSEKTDWFGP